MSLNLKDVPFFVLDLSPVAMGATVVDALHNTRNLARHAETVRQCLPNFIEETQPNELMFTSQISDHAARLRFLKL